MKKVIFVGLNEFNIDLLKDISEIIPNKYLTKLNNLVHKKLLVKDEYSSGFLEPWVQWVGIHTSTPSNRHKIKNLGDVPNLEEKQIWERLSDEKYNSIVWGAMNASSGDDESSKNNIFVPDPWVFSENTVPKNLNSFFNLPKYLAKEYTSISKIKKSPMVFNFVKSSVKEIGFLNFFKALKVLIEGLFLFGFKNFVFINFFDFLSSLIFLKKVNKKSFNLSFLFLNSIAHVQHHYWYSKDPSKLREIKFTYRNLDRILNEFEKNLGIFENKVPFFMLNGLTQENTLNDPDWILYRIKDLRKFLNLYDINFSKVETLMTNDAHIFFDDRDELNKAVKLLKEVSVNGMNIFNVKPNLNDLKIFINIELTSKVEKSDSMRFMDHHFSFEDYFVSIVKRTGKHLRECDLITNESEFDSLSNNSIYNYQIFNKIYPDFFKH